VGHGGEPDQQVRTHAQEMLPGDLLLRVLLPAQQHPQEQAQGVYQVGQGVHQIGQGVHQLGQGVHLLGQGVHQIGQGVHQLGQGVHQVRQVREYTR
jgi:uncharacterized phage infection (PIP) family protein YhgE